MEGAVTKVEAAAPNGSDAAEAESDLLSRPRVLRALIVAGLVAAVVLRVLVAAGPMGALNADEAVSGLMARHVLDGEYPVFYWGQNYGGTGEVFLTAGLFAVFDSATALLRFVPLALFAVAAFLIWRVGKRVIGEPGASVAAILFLLWPAWLVWKSLQAHGYYGFLLVTGVASLLLALRVDEAPKFLRYALLGLALGIGWWTSPQIALIGLPLIAWLAAQRNTRQWKGFVALTVGGVVGSAPWWIWNIANDWPPMVTEDPAFPYTTYVDRLIGLLQYVLPTGLGLRAPGGPWVLPDWLGWISYAVLLGAFVWFVVAAVRQKEPRLLLLCGIALAFPWLYALSRHSWYLVEPRYLLLLFPVMCLVVGWSFNRSYTVRIFTAGLTIPLAALGIWSMTAQFANAPDVGENPRPTRLTSVLDVLREHDVRYVIASYWIAYPISFETREEIIATSSGHVRYQP
ncbi:MAG: glycosyltransferase family 39 protein, partial [Beggiatoa sp.]|nr:glycosyltransferase family 39 protein [Beggiatoa sp.]